MSVYREGVGVTCGQRVSLEVLEQGVASVQPAVHPGVEPLTARTGIRCHAATAVLALLRAHGDGAHWSAPASLAGALVDARAHPVVLAGVLAGGDVAAVADPPPLTRTHVGPWIKPPLGRGGGSGH